jgi:hypothetical protein
MRPVSEIKLATTSDSVQHLQDIDESPVLLRAFAPLHRIAMGVAGAVVVSGLLAIVTIVLWLRGTDEAITAGSLLGQFLWGYSVSVRGIFIGLIWGVVIGFVMGYGFALVRNAAVWLWLTLIRSRAEMDQYSDFLDHM